MALSTIKLKKWSEFTDSDVFSEQFLKEVLPGYLQTCRWFGAKNSAIRRYNAELIIPLSYGQHLYYLIVLEITFESAYTENYLLVLGQNEDQGIPQNARLAELHIGSSKKMLIDALYDERFREFLFVNTLAETVFPHPEGSLDFTKGRILADWNKNNKVASRVLNAEQSNTTIVFNDNYYLKIYRKLFRDANPDYELTYFLSEKTKFTNSPRFAGSITWKRGVSYEVTIALMQEKVENKGDAWTYMLDEVKQFYRRLEDSKIPVGQLDEVKLYNTLRSNDLSNRMTDLVGEQTVRNIQKLALRTAQMHLALFKDKFTRRFVPKAFNTDYKAWLLNRMIYHVDHRCNLLENSMHKLSGEALEYAKQFLLLKPRIKDRILNFHSSELYSMRVRIHGDYHLGQVILTEDDFYILDFEGEPEATIRDRKVKQPPMKDVAGMLRSFQYAIYANIFSPDNNISLSQKDQFLAGERYYSVIVGLFLSKYIDTAFDAGLDIGYKHEIDFLLRYHLLEKAIYEMGYELNSRPDWVIIPLKGVLDLINDNQHGK